MNKLILVVLLTFTAMPTMAKTKVFGELHASYNKVFEVGVDSIDNFALNNSIIGFKGATELKKDLSFIYQLSWGVSSNSFDDKNNSGFNNRGFNNRNQVIGLASPSGAVVIGRFDTPFKTIGKKADLFWHSQLGQNRNITNASNWDIRADKIIAFQSPIKKGFQASVAYATDIADTSRVTLNGQAYSANAFYKKGKFTLSAGYEQHDLDRSSAYQSAKTEALRFSALAKHGPYSFVGFLQKEDNDFTKTSQADATVYGLGLAYKKGKGTLKAQFYSRNIKFNNKDSALIAMGYDYKASRQLTLYAQAANINNAIRLGGYELVQSNDVTSNDAHGVSLGIRYKF